MGRYVIARTLPGAGDLSEQECARHQRQVNSVLDELDEVSWAESYVSEDKLYSVYGAADPSLIEEHARRGQFPVDLISPVRATISPETGR